MKRITELFEVITANKNLGNFNVRVTINSNGAGAKTLTASDLYAANKAMNKIGVLLNSSLNKGNKGIESLLSISGKDGKKIEKEIQTALQSIIPAGYTVAAIPEIQKK